MTTGRALSQLTETFEHHVWPRPAKGVLVNNRPTVACRFSRAMFVRIRARSVANKRSFAAEVRDLVGAALDGDRIVSPDEARRQS